MASFFFDKAFKAAFSAQIDFARDEFYVVLCSHSYWPEKGVDEFRSDITHEVIAPGYAKGGLPIDLTMSIDGSRFIIGFGEAIWPQASITARYAVYYARRGAPEDDRVVSLIDFGADVSSNNGPFTL